MASIDQREHFTYETGKGTLVGFMPEKGQNIKVYCSRCSMDTEMYPEGYFTVAKSLWKLRRIIPCGCSKSPRYTEHQWIIKVKRKLNSLGRTLIGIDFSKGVNNKARVYFTNKTTVGSTSINLITNGKHQVIDLTQIPDSCGDFFQQEKFNFISSVAGYTTYTCKVCEEDRYTTQGLCTGIFKNTNINLGKGKTSCRCNKWVRKSPDMWKLDVTHFMDKSRLDGFCENINEVKQSKDKVKWVCNKCNYKNSTTVGGLSKIQSCAKCYQNDSGLYGHYKKRLEDTDYLYLISLDGENLFKIGRSFTPQNRLLALRRFCEKPLEIVYLWEGKHRDIFRIEQEVFKKFKSHRVRVDWTTELLQEDVIEQVVSYLNNKNEVQLYVQ